MSKGELAVESKGLKGGALGLVSSIVVGMASTAPAYSLAATLGLVVASGGSLLAGVKAPAIVLLAFIPMYMIAVAYQELNKSEPDCGTTFTWATRAFGPLVGWMGGWGIIAADATGAGGTYNGYRMAYSLSTTLTAQDIADAGTGSNFASVKSAALTFETWLNSGEDGTRVVNAPLTSTSDSDAWNLYNGDAIGRDIAGQGQYFVTDLVDGSEMTNWIFDNGLIDGKFFRESTYTAQSNWRLNLNTNQLVYAPAPAPVPVPAALWLLGSALVGVAGVRRRA
jgi:amino acid transporter